MGRRAFEKIKAGLEDAIAHTQGDESRVRLHHIKAPVIRELNAASVRRKTGLSQVAFARYIGVSVGTLQNWEKGSRNPSGPARVLLNLLDKKPDVVQEILAA